MAPVWRALFVHSKYFQLETKHPPRRREWASSLKLPLKAAEKYAVSWNTEILWLAQEMELFFFCPSCTASPYGRTAGALVTESWFPWGGWVLAVAEEGQLEQCAQGEHALHILRPPLPLPPSSVWALTADSSDWPRVIVCVCVHLSGSLSPAPGLWSSTQLVPVTGWRWTDLIMCWQLNEYTASHRQTDRQIWSGQLGSLDHNTSL